MKRYYFNFKWRDDAVFDEEGIELENFAAAYIRACGLVQEVLRRVPEGGSDWWIEISSGTDPSIAVVPAMVPGANKDLTQGVLGNSSKEASTNSLASALNHGSPER